MKKFLFVFLVACGPLVEERRAEIAYSGAKTGSLIIVLLDDKGQLLQHTNRRETPFPHTERFEEERGRYELRAWLDTDNDFVDCQYADNCKPEPGEPSFSAPLAIGGATSIAAFELQD